MKRDKSRKHSKFIPFCILMLIPAFVVTFGQEGDYVDKAFFIIVILVLILMVIATALESKNKNIN